MARMPRLHRGSLTWTLIALFIVTLCVPAAADDSRCDGAVPILLPNGTVGDVHDPDSSPPPTDSIDPTGRLRNAPTSAPAVACIDDGISGNRIQALYVVAQNKPDRSDVVNPLIRQAISDVNEIFRSTTIPGVTTWPGWTPASTAALRWRSATTAPARTTSTMGRTRCGPGSTKDAGAGMEWSRRTS
jgi:hypothetical protein